VVGGVVDVEEDGIDDEEHHASEPPSLHSALQTLLQLDPHGQGDVDAELAASICDFDRELVLTLIQQASEQEITWRRSGSIALAGDDDEARVCFGEARGWDATRETLRAALRVIVERRRAEATASLWSTRTDDPRRRRRARGEVQESLVDEATLRRDATGQDLWFESETRTE
jgi:hypothetical protein